MIGPEKTSAPLGMLGENPTKAEGLSRGMNLTKDGPHERVVHRIKNNAVRDEDGVGFFQMDKPLFSRRSGQIIF